ncbi:MAG TPA: exopolysaccharide biosynthesis protein [Opitutus sp.]|nr:exopolysaccharide biosynthesis protein [Opitutus sp.]
MATGAAPERPAGPAVSPRPLSLELAELAARVSGGPVTLRAVLEALRGRAYELLMILFVLPFAAPVAVPGTSTPFGLAIAGIAVQLAAGRLPWLPRWVLDARLPGGFFAKVMVAARGVVKFLEKFLRARGPALTASRRIVGVHLAAIVVAALVLALPLPIPFTNTLPGWAILLLALGLMERDGLFILAGHTALALSVAYFLLLGESVRHSIHWASHWLGG